MMTRRIPVVVVVLTLLGAVPATAQVDDQTALDFMVKAEQERLKGVTGAFVRIDLNDASASCGITETGLTTTASKALLDNDLAVNPEADGPPDIPELGRAEFQGLGAAFQGFMEVLAMSPAPTLSANSSSSEI